MTGRGQRLVNRMKNELVQSPRIPKPHFGFCWMDVYIHAICIHLQKQDKSRMPVEMEDIAVGFAQSMRNQLVAHKPTIHEEVLGVSGGSGIGGQRGHAG